MIDTLQSIDTTLFLFFNKTLANPVFDLIMPFITSNNVLRVALLLVLLWLVLRGGKYGRITALLALLTVLVTDQLSSELLKPLFERIRPCHLLNDMNLLVNCSEGLSFPSSHAANSVGQAMVLTLRYPRYRWYAATGAILISYSRVVVGVHYPFDLVAGAVVGIISAAGIIGLYRYAERLEQRRRKINRDNNG